jgi:hypothetical protein
MDALASRTIALALLWCTATPVLIAGESAPRTAQPPAPATQEDEVLGEVTVSGARASRRPSEVFTWMRRLVGQFAYEGHVDLGGQGNPHEQLPVQGQADCLGFGPAPAVQCEIRVSWAAPVQKQPGAEHPDVISNLNPAMILFGFEPDEVGIRFMQVDNKGIAEPSVGLVVGDTLVARAPCVNQPGNCQRATRITAEPDLKTVEMHIDIEVDYRRTLAYRFVMRRVSGPP